MSVLTPSAYRPLVQFQPSISEAFEQLSVFSHKWKAVAEPRNLDDFAAVSRGISWAGKQNLAKFSAENCEPYIWTGHSY